MSETWFQEKYDSSSWLCPLMCRGGKRSENYFISIFNSFQVWCSSLVTVDVKLKTSLICLVGSSAKMLAASALPFLEGNQGKSSHIPGLEKVRRGVVHVSWLGLDWSASKLVS